ncbi:MAG: hypothetical protein V4502_06090 [Pseudomonadota bacterium]
MVRPPEAGPNPLDSLARVLQIKAQQQLIPGQIALQNQQVQEGALRLKNAQAVQTAFDSANQRNPDGTTSFNMDNLKTALSGTPGGLEALTHIGTYEKGQADLQEAQGKVDVLHRNNGGSIGAAVDTVLDKDPLAAGHLFLTMGANGVANKTIDPKSWAPYQQAVQNALAQDPTGQSAAPILKQITQMLRQNSPEQQKLANEAITAKGAQQRGNAAEANADLAQAKFTAEQPKIAADTTVAQQKAAGTEPITPYQQAELEKTPKGGNPTEASLALAVAKGRAPDASPADVATGRNAELALKRLDQSKLASRPNINVNMTPAQAESTADLIGQGKIDPATTRAMLRRQPGLMAQVVAKYPDFDDANIEKRYNVGREFASSSNSKAGGQVIALNTLIHHADLYMQTAEALKNGSFKPGNAVYNAVASTFGSAPPTQANLVARFFAGETAKVATGGVPAEGEVNGILAQLGNNASPDQIAGAGKTLLQIAGGRMTPLMEKAKDAHLENVYPVIGPDAAEILKRRGFNPATMKPNAGGPAGAGVRAVTGKAERDALPSGTQYTKPGDPNVYTKQ